MMPDWTAISTRVTQIIEVLHLGDEPLAAARLDSAEVRKVGSTPLVIALLAPAGDGQ